MNNYQLYRTNELLGGQMKLNIIIGLSSHNKIVVKGFDISPISSSISYSRTTDNDLLNYDHQSNVKTYYSKISEHFYDPCTSKELSSIYPIITNKIIDSHDNTFEMGCRRMNYSIYGTQFEYLCPIWLEKLENDINFKFSFFANTENDSFYNTSFNLTTINGDDLDEYEIFHNKFINYFENYIKYLELDKGNDEILNVNISDISTISGLDVSSGQYVKKNLMYLSSNLMEREIPKIVFDEKIINVFREYNMVAGQLFNFNICFNIEDLLPKSLYDNFYKYNCYVNLVVGVDNKELELRDFYNNYEYIPKKLCGNDGDTILKLNKSQYSIDWVVDKKTNTDKIDNVLNYLSDYNNIDYIYKNKISQSIIHWSLNEDNDYIFNLYNGFSGVNNDGGEKFYRTKFYDNTPDILSKSIKYDKQLNNDAWCNVVRLNANALNDDYPITLKSTLEHFKNDLDDGKFNELFSKFGNGIVNGISYKTNNEEFINCLLVICKGVDLGEGLDSDNTVENLAWKIYEKENKICFFTNKDRNEDYYPFTYRKILETIKEREEPVFKKLYHILTNYKEFKKISFSNTSSINLIKSGILKSKEISYINGKNNIENSLLRYDGEIKPTFIKKKNDINHNYMYYKKLFSINGENDLPPYKNSIFANYGYNNKYSPIYPSVGYYSLNKIKLDYSYENKIFNVLEKRDEYCWFEKSKVLLLKNEFNVILSQDGKNGYKKIKELVEDYLIDYYGLKKDNSQYILSLYDFESSFDYKYIDDINEYEYYINIKLK